jgi:hypothetical protein
VFLGVFLGVFLATHMCAPPRGTHFLDRQGGRRGKEGNRVIVSGGGGQEEKKSEEEEEDGEDGRMRSRFIQSKAMKEVDAGGGVRSYLQAKYLGFFGLKTSFSLGEKEI